MSRLTPCAACLLALTAAGLRADPPPKLPTDIELTKLLVGKWAEEVNEPPKARPAGQCSGTRRPSILRIYRSSRRTT